MPYRPLARLLRGRPARPAAGRLSVTRLEERETPAVTLPTIVTPTDFASNKPFFLAVPATSSTGQPISYTASTDNANVTAQVVTGGRTLALDVTGTDSTGAAFSGTLTLRLFEDVAPQATGRIIQLTNQGFYNGLTFHRIIDNFVIQGGDPNGDGTGGSSLPAFSDEFNKDYTFTSSGLLALANSGDDTNNSQFFITDIDRTLAQRPENLNFNHTIFGILTSGFDTFQKVITTPTGTNDKPTNPVTITKASIITDTSNAVLRIDAQNGFTGAANVSVTATDGDPSPATETVPVTSTADATNDRPFLGPVSDQSVTANGSVSFTLPATDRDGDQLTYAVGSASDITTAPSNVTVGIDQSTGRVTLTPAAGFTGAINLTVGVRDQTPRAQNSFTGAALPLDSKDNFDTQKITLTVTPPAQTTVTLTASKTSVGAGRPVLFTAGVSGGTLPAGTVTFADASGTTLGTARVIDGRALSSISFPAAGSQTVTATFTPNGGTATAASSTPVTVLVSAATAPVAVLADSVPAGSPPRINVRNGDGTTRLTIQAFEDNFLGGVRVAVADATGDGQDDIIAVPGPGGGPIIRVFDGQTGALVVNKQIFEDFTGGLYLAAGDGFALGYAQILVGAGQGGGPRVTLYDAVRDQVLLNYFAYDPNLRGGVTVAMGDLRGGLQQDIVTGSGPGGGPQVNVYQGRTLDGSAAPTQVGQFLAGTATDRSGIRVAAGDLSADGTSRQIKVAPFTPETDPFGQTFDPVALGLFS
jgi:cyclophilin family peptidyl-prolyl cis-trans isomerase